MESLSLLKSAVSPSSSSVSRSNFPAGTSRRTVLSPSLRFRRSSHVRTLRLSVCWDEPPESLFMKELRRRGMTPTSLLEETKTGAGFGVDDDDVMKLGDGDRVGSKRNAVQTEIDKSLSNQRERSMALNSEGLEGLIPRARVLLTTGGTFFLGFGPLILVTVGVFSALYLIFGSSFVHDGSATPVSPPPYIDPYALLEEERISAIAPNFK
ncbi:hypothetical protein LINGRAHAP2_LOCUS32309 [Linum grandiflorum]